MVLWQGCGELGRPHWWRQDGGAGAVALPGHHRGLEARGPPAAFPVSAWPQAHLRPVHGEKWPQAYCFGCGMPCHDAIEHLRA